MERRKLISYVLDAATENLCNTLDPAKILVRLKTRQALSGGDVQELQSIPRLDDRVERLLEMLKRRNPNAYDEFMNALAEFRPDLYPEVKAIENSYLAASSYTQQYNPHAPQQQQTPTGAHSVSSGGPGTTAQLRPAAGIGLTSHHQQTPTDASNISFEATVQTTAANIGATCSSTVLPDTFPAELNSRINRLCGNNSGSQTGCTQTVAGSENHLLHMDAPQGMPSVASVSPSTMHPHDDIPQYQLRHEPRGLAIIINNETFVKKPPHNFEYRTGSYKDAGSLVCLFHSLKFQVLCKNNLTSQQMHDILDEIRRINHQNYDLFVCVILSHGQMGEVFGSDSLPIPIQELTGLFNGFKCETLCGKPKMFFIQACQGNVKQPGAPAKDNPPENAQTIIDTIPIENDYLVGYSTLPGYASYRNPMTGSWYVISLVQHIQLYRDRVDMANMLALVNGHMGKCSDDEGYKQSCQYKSTLTKLLYL